MHQAGKPFFMWVNFTHMHLRTHAKPESVGQSGRWQSPYHDVMIDHDRNVGTVLAKLDELGLADNTIVMYGTDNGPHANTWPDGATTPFRSEKNTNWEGAFRVPCLVRWPGKIKPGSVSNEIVSHHDWLPTLAGGGRDAGRQGAAARGLHDRRPHVQGASRRLQSAAVPDRAGEPRARARASSTSPMTATCWRCAMTTGRWCSPSSGRPARWQLWAEPFTHLRVPKLFNLRTDPFERADITSNTYWDWLMDHVFLIVPAQALVAGVPGDLQGLSAAAEGRELHHRSGDGEADGASRRLTMPRPPSARLRPRAGAVCCAHRALAA